MPVPIYTFEEVKKNWHYEEIIVCTSLPEDKEKVCQFFSRKELIFSDAWKDPICKNK